MKQSLFNFPWGLTSFVVIAFFGCILGCSDPDGPPNGVTTEIGETVVPVAEETVLKEAIPDSIKPVAILVNENIVDDSQEVVVSAGKEITVACILEAIGANRLRAGYVTGDESLVTSKERLASWGEFQKLLRPIPRQSTPEVTVVKCSWVLVKYDEDEVKVATYAGTGVCKTCLEFVGDQRIAVEGTVPAPDKPGLYLFNLTNTASAMTDEILKQGYSTTLQTPIARITIRVNAPDSPKI